MEKIVNKAKMFISDVGKNYAGAQSLEQERKNADRQTALQRSRLDREIEMQPATNTARFVTLLEKERANSDSDLAFQRNAMDSASSKSAEELRAEIAAHRLTKSIVSTIEEFVAIVSHDLRSPIGNVLAAAAILKEEMELGPHSEVNAKLVEIIGRNTSDAMRLISYILDMERVKSGKLTLQLENSDWNALMQQAVASVALEAKKKGVAIICESSPSPQNIFCDRDRLLQVIGNLIGNALKFTPKGGQITIGASPVGSDLKVTVSDTGPGISDVHRERIFERFSQLNQKDARGLGLGLYISRMFVEAHGGRIWLEPGSTAGSRFSFTIPGSPISEVPVLH